MVYTRRQSHLVVQEISGHLCCWDDRSERKAEIAQFLSSEWGIWLLDRLEQSTCISLGWDGLFIDRAKYAFEHQLPILWLHFWTRGFLLDDPMMVTSPYRLVEEKHSVLEVRVSTLDGELLARGSAINEVYLTRSGDSSGLDFVFKTQGYEVSPYGDGVMIATPLGSTGWSRSYDGIILPRDAHDIVMTPVGWMTDRTKSRSFSSEYTFDITVSGQRWTSADILLDNTCLLRGLTGPYHLSLEVSRTPLTLITLHPYAPGSPLP